MITLIESHYFPCIEYFHILKNREEINIEAKENFQKQSYRNRCYILSSNQKLSLAIPMQGGNKHLPMDEIKIDYSQNWQKNHWRAITSAYNRSPFFEFYESYIHDIIFRNHETLLTLNKEILTFCLKILNIDTPVEYTSLYQKEAFATTEDLRSVIHPKKTAIYQKTFKPISYQQLFGEGFASNLSILDLISCVGPDAQRYL